MGFPEIKFGICPICEAAAADDANASGADVSARDTTGDGVVLEYYQGELMCELCKKQKIADEESLRVSERHADEERFRHQAGFINSV